MYMRKPLKMDVIRDRNSMGREVEDGMIENTYRLQIMNTTEQSRSFRIQVKGIPTLTLATPPEVTGRATETYSLPVRLRIAGHARHKRSNKIETEPTALDNASLKVEEKAVFIVPN